MKLVMKPDSVPSLTVIFSLTDLETSSLYLENYNSTRTTLPTLKQMRETGNYSLLENFMRKEFPPRIQIAMTTLNESTFNYPDSTQLKYRMYLNVWEAYVSVGGDKNKSFNSQFTYEIDLRRFFANFGSVSIGILMHDEALTNQVTDRSLKIVVTNKRYRLSFYKTTIKLLPEPYDTKCKWNFPFNSLTSDECECKCLAYYSILQCGVVYDYILMDVTGDTDLLRGRHRNECYMKHRIRSRCVQMCAGISCVVTYYTLSYDSYDVQCEYCISLAYSSNNANFRYKALPRLQGLDLVVSVGSILSMWFGFAIYSLLISLREHLIPSYKHTAIVRKMQWSMISRLGVLDRGRFKLVTKLRWLLKHQRYALLSFMIAASVFCYLSLLILIEYYTRQALVHVYLLTDGPVDMPGIFVGFNTASVVNHTKLCNKRRCDRRDIERAIHNGDVHGNVLDPKTVFPDCKVYLSEIRQFTDCSNATEILTAVGEDSVYFAFFVNMTKRPTYDFNVVGNYYFNIRISNVVLDKSSKNATLQVCLNSGIPETLLKDIMQVELGRYKYIVNYRGMTLKRLPEPYSTACLDYTKTKYLSQIDCIAKCTTKNVINYCGAAPRTLIYYDSQILRRRNDSCIHKLSKIYLLRCQKQCHQRNCQEELYLDGKISALTTTENASIFIRLPTDTPPLIFEYKPRQKLLDVISYLAGTLALTFGSSVLDFTWIFCNYIERWYKKHSQRPPPPNFRPKFRLHSNRFGNKFKDCSKILTKSKVKTFAVILISFCVLGHSVQVITMYTDFDTSVQTVFVKESRTFPTLSITVGGVNYTHIGSVITGCQFDNYSDTYVAPCEFQFRKENKTYISVTAKNPPGAQYKVKLDISMNVHLSSFDVMFHSPFIAPHVDTMKSFTLTTDKYNSVYLTYSKITVHKLPPPYSKGCSPLKTCFPVCMGRPNLFERQGNTSNEKSETNEEKKHRCQNECAKTNCRTEYYFIDIAKSMAASGESFMRVEGGTPNLPTIEYIFHPAFDFMDFVLYFGNMLGLWIGFNVLVCLTRLSHYTTNCQGKRVAANMIRM